MSVEMNPGEPWGKCFVSGCPLFGSLGRGSDWACYCHFNTDASKFSEITNMLLRERAIGESAVEIRMHYGTERWPSAYREIQKRLVTAERQDMLFNADGKDTPPSPPCPEGMMPVVKLWLARLENELQHKADEIGHSHTLPFGSPIVPTAHIVGPTHAMTHYSEPRA